LANIGDTGGMTGSFTRSLSRHIISPGVLLDRSIQDQSSSSSGGG
jgi:hypothetical protein